MKNFVPKDGSGEPPSPGRNGTCNFHKEKRSNETYASTTDPEAQLFRKGNGQSGRLCFMGHALMENRNGLIVDCELAGASGMAEREAALTIIKRSRKTARRTVRKARVKLGADKSYDAQDFVLALKGQKVTPHIAINGTFSNTGKLRKNAVDGRTTRHEAGGSASASANASRKASTGPRPSAVRQSSGSEASPRPRVSSHSK